MAKRCILSLAQKGQGGFVFVLLALSLTVLIGGVAYVIDTGSMMVNAQRSQTAVDLAALSGSIRLKEELNSSDAETQSRYVLAANDYTSGLTANHELRQHELSFEPEVRITRSAAANWNVTVSQVTHRPTYFAHILSATDLTPGSSSSAAEFAETGSGMPLNLILLLDSSLDAEAPIDPDCVSIPRYQRSTSFRRDYLEPFQDPNCPSKASVIKTMAKNIVENLSPEDRVSIVKSSGITRALGVEKILSGSPELLTMQQMIDDISIDWWGTGDRQFSFKYEMLSDPSVALYQAYKIFEQSTELAGRNPTVMYLTTATPRQDPMFEDDWSYTVAEYPAPVLGNYLDRSDLRAESWYDEGPRWLEDPDVASSWRWSWDIRGPDALTQVENPSTREEMYAFQMRRYLQLAFGARLYAVGVGVGKYPIDLGVEDDEPFRFASPIVNNPSRNRNYLRGMAGDISKTPVPPWNNVDPLDSSDSDFAGRYFEVNSPSGSKPMAEELVNHARVVVHQPTQNTSVLPHLIQPIQ